MSITSDWYQKAAETRLANLDYLKGEAIADRHEISDSRVIAYLREARKKIPEPSPVPRGLGSLV